MLHSKTVKNKCLFTLLLLTTSSSMSLLADDSKGVFTFSLENDLFGGGSDRHYTSGFELSYVSDTYHPSWVENTARLLPFYYASDDMRFGFSIGQAIFTPDDITQKQLIVDDRPYAGWLYTTFSLVSDGREQINALESVRYANSFDLTFGIVGPSSGADETQKAVHKWVDTTRPQGWKNQLEDEFGFIFSYTRLWQSDLGDYMDLTPQVGFSLGNVYTFTNIGVTLRLGPSLSKDLGPPLIRPSITGSHYFQLNKKFEWYLFASLGGRYIAQNIFLDGNTEKESHSVDKRKWVGDAQAGLVANYGNLQLALVQVYRTKEFYEQRDKTYYGAITAGWRY